MSKTTTDALALALDVVYGAMESGCYVECPSRVTGRAADCDCHERQVKPDEWDEGGEG